MDFVFHVRGVRARVCLRHRRRYLSSNENPSITFNPGGFSRAH